MRRTRVDIRSVFTFIGYDPSDVQMKCSSLQHEIKLVEIALEQEQKAFVELYGQKLQYLKLLEKLLDEARIIENEQLVRSGSEQ